MAVSTNDKKLNGSGLSTLWGLIKNAFAPNTPATDSKGGIMTDAQAAKLAGIEAGADANVIDGVKVNGSALTPDANKDVDITIPITSVKVNNTALTPSEHAVNITVPTTVSALTNDSDFQSGTQVDNKIASAISSTYKPAGTITASGISNTLLVEANEGKVYNVSGEFTTTADFVEGAGKKYPAGTNIVVINTAESGQTAVYKFDVLAGFVDLSNYATDDDVEALTTAEIEAICV